MGIAPSAVKIFMTEGLRSPLTGRLCTLGKQDIYLTYQKLKRLSTDTGFNLSPLMSPPSPNKREFVAAHFMSDKALFQALGFSETRSLDFSDYERADEVFDLNNPELPSHLTGAFDVVFDGGTVEHVFHLPNVLKNISEMIKEGGRIIHLSPSNNYVDHGFYMFSPTLFYDYYRSNRFEINTLQLIRHTINHATDPWLIYDYTPGCLDQVSFGGLDDGMYAILCVVTKTGHVASQVIPQQTHWAKSWNVHGSGNSHTLQYARQGMFTGIKEAIKNHPAIYNVVKPLVDGARYLKRKIQKKGVKLKLKARY